MWSSVNSLSWCSFQQLFYLMTYLHCQQPVLYFSFFFLLLSFRQMQPRKKKKRDVMKVMHHIFLFIKYTHTHTQWQLHKAEPHVKTIIITSITDKTTTTHTQAYAWNCKNKIATTTTEVSQPGSKKKKN